MKNKKIHIYLIVFISAMPYMASAGDGFVTNNTSVVTTMHTIPSKYESVKLNTFAESGCSPILDEDQIGIIISSPEKIIVSDEYILPVCGSWQFTLKLSNKFGDISNNMVLIVVDSKTHQSYSSNLLTPGFTAPESRKWEGSDKELEENTVSGWFNVDVFRYIRKLPRVPATYTIFATIGDVKSNVIKVEISK